MRIGVDLTAVTASPGAEATLLLFRAAEKEMRISGGLPP